MADLPVNFKDDILAASMGGKRRYNMIQNEDGTVSFEDVTTYQQEGSNFGAAQINATNASVNGKVALDNVISTLEELQTVTEPGFWIDALVAKSLYSNNVELIAQLKTDSSSETVVSCPDLNKYRELIFEIYPGAYDSGTVDGVVSQYHNRKYFQELNHPMIVSWPSDFYFRFAYVSNTSIKIYVSDAWSRSCKIYGIY